MTPQRVNLITLGVADLGTSKTFYDRLGWREVKPQDGIAFYKMNGLLLGLFPLGELAKDQGRPEAGLGTGAMTLAQNFATQADVDAAWAAAVSAGATPLKKPQKVFWGGYSGYYADPDGHVWEVAMNPFWQLTEDGRVSIPDAVN
jgi:predicted lactoylglutathione lyase